MRIPFPLMAGRIRRGVSAAVVVLGAFAVTASTAGQVSAAPVVPDGRVVASAVFSGVSCPQPTWCMAVGNYVDVRGGSHSLAEVWNGQSWRVLADPPGPGLVSLSCSATWFCMVFGSQPTTPTGTMIWNGRGWREVARPHDAAGGPSCGSSSFCVAQRFRNQSVLAWNGHTWQNTQLCVESDVCVTGLSCASGSLCAAVGGMENDIYQMQDSAFIWNKLWKNASPTGYGPPDQLNAVSCRGKICVAVGDSYNTAEAFEWNNATQSWQDISPNNGINFTANAISCGSPSSCMTSANTWWDGATWQNAPFASTGPGSKLPSMSCSGAICLAVGYQTVSASQQTLAELWNGTTWKIIATPAFRRPTARVRNIHVGGSPQQVAIDASRGAVWVATRTRLVRISEATQRVTARVRFPGSLIAVDPKTGTVWAVDQADSRMAEVSEATNKVIRTYTGIGQFGDKGSVGGIATDARTGSVWVASAATLDLISEARHRVARRITLLSKSQKAQCAAVAVDPVRNTIWVPIVPELGTPYGTTWWVAEVSGVTGRVVGTYATGFGVKVVAVDSRHGLVWAWSQATVTLISEAGRAIVENLDVPVNDNWFAATIVSRRRIALVADSTFGKFYVLAVSQSSAKTLRTVPMGGYPADVKTDPGTGNVYVPIRGRGVVSQFKL